MAAIGETLALLIPPSFVEFWRERGRDWGPIAAGALFGGGVWIWGDAVATSPQKVPFDRVSFSSACFESARPPPKPPSTRPPKKLTPPPFPPLPPPLLIQQTNERTKQKHKFIPGLLALAALLMINAVRYDQLHEYDPFDDGGGVCRSRFWLFLSYLVSFAALTGSVWVLLQHYAFAPGGRAWTGVAGVLEVALVLASALVFFLSRTPVDGDVGGGAYGAAGYTGF
jgi:hypothetical protein